VEQKLRLAEFKALYKTWRRNIPWLDHLLLGLLVWFEEKLIDNRVNVEIDEAIKEWETLHTPLPDMVSPIYTESPSETSVSLPEMRLTAPWYVSPSDTDEGGLGGRSGGSPFKK
jgi:hypothetical protein